jgi:hypothetical protein
MQGDVTFVAEVNCYYTLTTITGVVKPSVVPSMAAEDPRPAFFPLPFSEDFEGEENIHTQNPRHYHWFLFFFH